MTKAVPMRTVDPVSLGFRLPFVVAGLTSKWAFLHLRNEPNPCQSGQPSERRLLGGALHTLYRARSTELPLSDCCPFVGRSAIGWVSSRSIAGRRARTNLRRHSRATPRRGPRSCRCRGAPGARFRKRPSSTRSLKLSPKVLRRRFSVRGCIEKRAAMSSILVRSVSNAMRRTRLTCSGNWSRNCASSASIFSFSRRRMAGSRSARRWLSHDAGKMRAFCSASNRIGARNNCRYGSTSTGLRCASITSLGFQSAPHSSRMMLTAPAMAPAPIWPVASVPG